MPVIAAELRVVRAKLAAALVEVTVAAEMAARSEPCLPLLGDEAKARVLAEVEHEAGEAVRLLNGVRRTLAVVAGG